MSMPRRPTRTGATISAPANPSAPCTWKATYAPSVKSAPWAKLMTPIMPKMIDRPSAINTYRAPRRDLLDDLEDVPLVLPLRLVFRGHDVHRLQELVVPRAEGQRPALEAVHRSRQRVALERRDQLRAVRGLRLVDRLGDRVDREIVAVRLVVGRAAPALHVARGPGLARRIV